MQFFQDTSTLDPNRSYFNSQLFSNQIFIDADDNRILSLMYPLVKYFEPINKGFLPCDLYSPLFAVVAGPVIILVNREVRVGLRFEDLTDAALFIFRGLINL